MALKQGSTAYFYRGQNRNCAKRAEFYRASQFLPELLRLEVAVAPEGLSALCPWMAAAGGEAAFFIISTSIVTAHSHVL